MSDEPDSTGRQRFLDSMDSELTGWKDPVVRLREALEQDGMQLFCQPILALADPQHYEMAEVLVRLREEEELLLPPGEFLPVFERFRMLPELDRWVVSRVVRWLGGAPPGGFRRFSVNVSGQSLEDGGLPGFVVQELNSVGVPPEALCFEIDEADTLQRLALAEKFASAVKQAGCKLLIDGFGGRSVSFAPLKSLRVDYVKVDGAIIRNILRSKIALLKLKAILRVGEVIGIGIIAECVEEPEIIVRLTTLGVGFAQGFGIARPSLINTDIARTRLAAHGHRARR